MKDIKTPLTFIEVNANQPIPDNLLSDLMHENIAGIIVKNFLSKHEVELVKQKIKNIPLSKKSIVNEGFQTYPISFALYTQQVNSGKMTVKQYMEIAKETLKNETKDFGLNITQRLFAFLKQHKVFEEVSPILENKSNQPLVPFNLRELFPGKGELIAHCENLFFQEFPDFFNWLKRMDIKENKLSYFITVQKPDSGGELCCYEFNWSKVKTRVTHTTLKDTQGRFIDINDDKLEKVFVVPDEGDLLIFAGGNIWHRVLTVQGSKSRITFGGFIAESNKKGKYYVWS